MKKNNKGFTLFELIVVLVILAILAAMLIPALTGYIDRSNQEKLKATTRQVVVAAQTVVSETYAEKESSFGEDFIMMTTFTGSISIAQGGEGNPVLSSDDIAEILELAEIVTSDFSYNAETGAATGKFKNEISQVNISWDDKGKITYVGVGTSERMCEYRAENSEYTITVY